MFKTLRPWQLLVVAAAGWVNRDQQAIIDYLREEDRVLREQLGRKRLRLTDDQRRRLAAKGKLLGRRILREIASIVSPDTILACHRKLIARKWDYSARRRGPGRPGVMRKIADLLTMMARENPGWGYSRIQGALDNLGHRVSRTTVANLLKQHGIDPAPRRRRVYIDQALALAPNYPLARVYRAMTPVLRDGTEEAARTAATQFDRIATGPWKYAHGWQMLLYARDFDGAIDFISPVERVTGQWYDYPTPLLIAWTRHLQDRSDEAMAGFTDTARILEADLQADPDDARLHSSLALAYAGLGRKEEALREGRRSVELMPLAKDAFAGAWLLQDLAWVYTMTGEFDAAVETIDRVLSVPSVWSIEALLLDPRVDPLREHGGFRALVEKHRREG